jgi:hypothetical protein
MNKVEVISRIAVMPDDDPRLPEVDAILNGSKSPVQVESRLGLAEVARHPLVRLHPTYLWKLQVPLKCGEMLAGRRGYRLSQVLSYLQSFACQTRITELRTQRQARERLKNMRHVT